MQEPTLVINTEGAAPTPATFNPTDIVSISTTGNLTPKGTLLTIYGDKSPYLTTPSIPFDFAKPPMHAGELAESLTMTMKKYNGVGLSAIQCHIPLRVMALDCDLVCFNPRVVSTSDASIREKEGCLSFPGLFIPITRSAEVTLTWQDYTGGSHEQTFTGLTARTILHELDHLDGVVFTQLVGSLTLQMAKKKKLKMMKRIERHLQHSLNRR